LMLAACAATPADRRELEDRPIVEEDDGARIEDVAPAPRKARPEQKEIDPDLAVDLDLEVLKFTSLVRELARDAPAPGARKFWPEKLRSAWSRIIVHLQDSLSRAPGDYPAPLLLRTRIVLDSELEESKRRFGREPETIRDGMKSVYGLLTKHVRDPATPKTEPRSAVEIAMVWPVARPIVTSPFGKRNDPIIEEGAVRFHAGVDLGGITGDLVAAAAPGRVTFAGWLPGSGNTVVVHHDSSYVTLYGHMSDLLVNTGARVTAGTPVGFIGSTGRSTGPHLHFEVRRRGVPVDPELVIRAKRANAT
jgi:murein DD-endopeptidase MepM/ murein hydrolase activator NlpD